MTLERTGLTVSFDAAITTFNHHAEFGPFREIFEVETDVVCFGKMIQVARVEIEEIRRRHGSD